MVFDIESDTLPNRDALQLRWEISDLIEEQGIGEVIGSGGGCGEMDIGVEVTDVKSAKSQMRAIAEQYQLNNVKFT